MPEELTTRRGVAETSRSGVSFQSILDDIDAAFKSVDGIAEVRYLDHDDDQEHTPSPFERYRAEYEGGSKDVNAVWKLLFRLCDAPPHIQTSYVTDVEFAGEEGEEVITDLTIRVRGKMARLSQDGIPVELIESLNRGIAAYIEENGRKNTLQYSLISAVEKHETNVGTLSHDDLIKALEWYTEKAIKTKYVGGEVGVAQHLQLRAMVKLLTYVINKPPVCESQEDLARAIINVFPEGSVFDIRVSDPEEGMGQYLSVILDSEQYRQMFEVMDAPYRGKEDELRDQVDKIVGIEVMVGIYRQNDEGNSSLRGKSIMPQ